MTMHGSLTLNSDLSLLVILVVTGIGAAALVTIAGAALFRRRSLPYLLVVAALGTLLLRTALGIVSVGGFMSMASHHLFEHFLDALATGLLFGAVYTSRSTARTSQLDEQRLDRSND